MEKQASYTVIGVVAIIVASIGLFILARGSGYQITILDPTTGAGDAPILIEEYFDYECPACKSQSNVLAEVQKLYPTQVKMVFHDFILPGDNMAKPAAIASLCAVQQDKFSVYHKAVFEKQDELISGDIDSVLTALAMDAGLNIDIWQECRKSKSVEVAINKDFVSGQKLGIDSIPALFLNGDKIETNPASVFAWMKIIEQKLNDLGIESEATKGNVQTDDIATDNQENIEPSE